jgi:hypothetical protein
VAGISIRHENSCIVDAGPFVCENTSASIPIFGASHTLVIIMLALLLLVALFPAASQAALCCCGKAGAGCTVDLSVTPLVGTSGSITGSTTGRPNFFGGTSPDAYYYIDVPPGTTSISFTTCHPSTNYDAWLWIYSSCLAGNNDGSLISAGQSPWELQNNDDFHHKPTGVYPGSCTCTGFDTDSCSGGSCPFLDSATSPFLPSSYPLPVHLICWTGMSSSAPQPGNPAILWLKYPASGRYYIVVDGYGGSSGTFGLVYNITSSILTAAVSPSPVSTPGYLVCPSSSSQPRPPSPSATASATASSTVTSSARPTSSTSASALPSGSPTASPSATVSSAPTPSGTESATPTPSSSASAQLSPSASPSASASESSAPSPSSAASASASESSAPSPSSAASATASGSQSPSSTVSPTASPSASSSASATASPSPLPAHIVGSLAVPRCTADVIANSTTNVGLRLREGIAAFARIPLPRIALWSANTTVSLGGVNGTSTSTSSSGGSGAGGNSAPGSLQNLSPWALGASGGLLLNLTLGANTGSRVRALRRLQQGPGGPAAPAFGPGSQQCDVAGGLVARNLTVQAIVQVVVDVNDLSHWTEMITILSDLRALGTQGFADNVTAAFANLSSAVGGCTNSDPLLFPFPALEWLVVPAVQYGALPEPNIPVRPPAEGGTAFPSSSGAVDAALVGGSLAAVLALCCCCLILAALARRRRKKKDEEEAGGAGAGAGAVPATRRDAEIIRELKRKELQAAEFNTFATQSSRPGPPAPHTTTADNKGASTATTTQQPQAAQHVSPRDDMMHGKKLVLRQATAVN